MNSQTCSKNAAIALVILTVVMLTVFTFEIVHRPKETQLYTEHGPGQAQPVTLGVRCPMMASDSNNPRCSVNGH